MSPPNDLVYRTNSTTERDIEKPTFNDADKALAFLRTEAEVGETDLVDEAQLVRKIDFMIVPIMFGCYCLQYLDKSLLNYASVMGLLEDADLTTEQYGTLSLIFYVAFLAFEMPHAYMMVSCYDGGDVEGDGGGDVMWVHGADLKNCSNVFRLQSIWGRWFVVGALSWLVLLLVILTDRWWRRGSCWACSSLALVLR
jgi:hypothetical protein